MLKMGYLSSQLSVVNLLPTVESAQFFGNRLKRLDVLLLVEIVLITIAAVSAINIFSAGWFMAPGILIAAALIPTVIRKSRLSEIGLSFGQIKHSFIMLGWTCLVVFPATFCGLWLLKSYGLNLPLRPVLPRNQEWLSWLFYQFMYVAVAEEVFFRGYVQSNVLRLLSKTKSEQWEQPQLISVVISAACFAAAHAIIQGQMISALIFLPGLILGWLFIRTKSLLAPILFHGLANVYYCFVAAALS